MCLIAVIGVTIDTLDSTQSALVFYAIAGLIWGVWLITS